jgi:hypothetical protein
MHRNCVLDIYLGLSRSRAPHIYTHSTSLALENTVLFTNTQCAKLPCVSFAVYQVQNNIISVLADCCSGKALNLFIGRNSTRSPAIRTFSWFFSVPTKKFLNCTRLQSRPLLFNNFEPMPPTIHQRFCLIYGQTLQKNSPSFPWPGHESTKMLEEVCLD